MGHLFENVECLNETTNAASIQVEWVGELRDYHIISNKKTEVQGPKDRKILLLHQEISDIWTKVAYMETGLQNVKAQIEKQVQGTKHLMEKVKGSYKELARLTRSISKEVTEKLIMSLKNNKYSRSRVNTSIGVNL